MAIYPLKLYKLRWGIETNYYEQNVCDTVKVPTVIV